ncbi:early nodulin-like protein 18 [Malania oleifera]|uniref:early nodulin-like protein 18 n=1 Tax=Malania oleifera TaxID=397392 RepID=UPI0025AE7499|nr:early nodulin-like protein 18 [Malania oleifera]
MEQRGGCNRGLQGLSALFFSFSTLFCCLHLLVLFSGGCVEGYKNYTVGDSLGWYDNLQKPSVNYQKWASSKHFSLGDFLIFNTDSNHSVVQTYNFTTYKHCDYDDAQDTDTTEWLGGEPSATNPQPVSFPVPLLKEGMIYFFSAYYDGDQCHHGQRFKINVTHGQGLPPSLKNQSPSATGASLAPAASPDAVGEEAAPDTIVSSNFDNPREERGDAKHSSSGCGSVLGAVKALDGKLSGILILLGLVFIV